jgi:hypothetical protein
MAGVFIKRDGRTGTFGFKPSLVDKMVAEAAEELASDPRWQCASDDIALFLVSEREALRGDALAARVTEVLRGEPLAADVVLRGGSYIIAKVSSPAGE